MDLNAFLGTIGSFAAGGLIWLLVYIRYFKRDHRPVTELWREWQERKDP